MNKVSIVVVNYNGRNDLSECFTSIEKVASSSYEIIMVDNASTDGSASFMLTNFPNVRLITLDKNYGHSYACNIGLKEASGDYVLIMDYDTIVGEKWLLPLLKAMHDNPKVGICVSRAIFYPEKELIHSEGGWAHYVGNMILKNGFAPRQDASDNIEAIGAAGTTSMLIDKKKALEIGGFDEDFFVYFNDFEFSLRMRLAGYHCLSIPESVIYHKGGNPAVSYRGKGSYPSLRAFYIFRNRWYMIVKLYSLKTLILCVPALLVYELAIIVMALKKRLFLTYLKAAYSFLFNLSRNLKKRKDIKKIRKISDRKLLTSGYLSFVPGSIKDGLQSRMVSLLNCFLIWYWNKIKVFM